MSSTTSIVYPKNSLKSWVVCLSASLFFFYHFLQLSMGNALGEPLKTHFQLEQHGLGHLLAALLLGNTLFVFPAGLLIDRYPVRRLLVIGLLISVLGAIGFVVTTHFYIAYTLRLLAGMADAFSLLGAARLVNRWFTHDKQAFVTGVVVAIGLSGLVVAQAPLAYLVDALGWKKALYLHIGFGLLSALCIACLVQEAPERLGYTDKFKRQPAGMSFWNSLRLAVSNPQNWLIGIMMGLINLPIMVLANFGPAFMSRHGVPKALAIRICTFLSVGFMLGSPFMGRLSDRWGKRKAPLYIGASGALALLALLLYGPLLSPKLLMGACFALGVCISAHIIGYALVADGNPPVILSAAMGLAASLLLGLAAFLGPSLTGRLLQTVQTAATAGTPAPDSVRYVFWILPAAMTLAIGLLSFIKKNDE